VRTVDIESELTAVSESGTVSFLASGKNCVLRLPEVGSPGRAVKLFSYLMNFRSALRLLHAICDSQGIGVAVEVAGRIVVRFGDRCSPGLFSRVLGVYPVEVKMVPIFATIIGASRVRR